MRRFRHRTPALLRALAATALLVAVPVALHAQVQATTGIIRGLVLDEAGAPVVDAVVTMRNAETNVSRTVRTSFSRFGSTSTTDCQVPSCTAPPTTGTTSEGATTTGSR